MCVYVYMFFFLGRADVGAFFIFLFSFFFQSMSVHFLLSCFHFFIFFTVDVCGCFIVIRCIQVFFRVSMAILDLSKEHLLDLDFDATVE